MISRAFIEGEIAAIEPELEKARVFAIQAQAVLDAYRMLLSKFEEPMVIYLKHPVHGSKVACSEEEAKSDEALGWTRYDPNAQPVKEPELDPVGPLDHDGDGFAGGSLPKKRGRPPKQ
jgi:hypothetical protein